MAGGLAGQEDLWPSPLFKVDTADLVFRAVLNDRVLLGKNQC